MRSATQGTARSERSTHVHIVHFLYFTCCNLVSLHRISTQVRLGVISVVLSLHGLSLYTCMLSIFCSVASLRYILSPFFAFALQKVPRGPQITLARLPCICVVTYTRFNLNGDRLYGFFVLSSSQVFGIKYLLSFGLEIVLRILFTCEFIA